MSAPGICRFCRCTEDNACRIPGGDTCSWYLNTRDVCTAPGCITAYHAEQRRLMMQASRATKKRTPGQVHAIIMDEKRAKRRAARARKKQQQRGAA